MTTSFLYGLGSNLAVGLPRKISYAVARRLADLYSTRSLKDCAAVRSNLRAVLGREPTPAQVREVFQNFAMYLADFFRFSRLTRSKAERMVRFDGLDCMEEALREGHGAVGATAHLGNYELAAAVLCLIGLPVHGVTMSHRNPQVDAFFMRQRERVGVRGIPVQKMSRKAFLESCLSVLRRNEILGLVADRDFFDHGLEMPLFGHTLRVPTGPAAFSLRTGAPVVPSFWSARRMGITGSSWNPPFGLPRVWDGSRPFGR